MDSGLGLGDTLHLAPTSWVFFLEQPGFSSARILRFGWEKVSGAEDVHATVGSVCPVPSVWKQEGEIGRGNFFQACPRRL